MQATVIKTCVQQSDHSSSATCMFAVQFFRRMSLPQYVITVTTVFPHHIYRPRGITVVTAVLPFSQLPCHPLYRTAVHWL